MVVESDSLDGAVIQILMCGADHAELGLHLGGQQLGTNQAGSFRRLSAGQRPQVDGESVILRGDLDPPVFESPNRVIATMVDMAALPAVFAGMKAGSQPAGTADLQVTYLRQAHGDWIDAHATVIKRGRALCTVEVSIVNDQGELCARGRVLYALRTVTE